MKKLTLLAATLVAISAQAQNVDPSTTLVVNQKPTSVKALVLSDAAAADLQKAGAVVDQIGPNDTDRFLYVWDGTFTAGDSTLPRVDMEEGDYGSFVVGTVGWSGAGFAINGQNTEAKGPGVDLSAFDNDTHFHLAYCSPTGNAPASIAVILLDGTNLGGPAKVALGDAFNDNGAIYPAVGAKATDEWQGLDITLGDLKKYYPAFALGTGDGMKTWGGNIMSFLGGGVTGQTLAFDAIYFYSTKAGSGVEGVEADAEFIVTENTINVAGANGIELYNLAGMLVKSTNGTTLGLNGLQNGVYVAKSGKNVRKVVIR